ncbi:MAG: hypothetical protein F6K40_04955 [Okeania sp. SIO3I5]|uniref:hypothetical protein n=1 Tax=Okeania sp. SIO3I5 TaxID=2607805 RepID=UPI0013B74335|nr:hypothetical protein [Okeania sp. SIO3I5]NEQ35676.1 hypothetical protein [Okeania sp. SIO3I5]
MKKNRKENRLEFHGILNLIEISYFHQDKKHLQSKYSGFLVYSEDTLNSWDTLIDWEIKVDGLNFNLKYDSIGRKPSSYFHFSSPLDLVLIIDFGIATCLPRYTVKKDLLGITFEGEHGRTGSYIYQDSLPIIMEKPFRVTRKIKSFGI